MEEGCLKPSKGLESASRAEGESCLVSQSWLPISTIVKNAPKVLSTWPYAKNLAMLQIDRVRNYYLRPADGRAGRIRQVSIRITDLCNLRCHTCGQWGDRGFLHHVPLDELKKQEVSTERYIELLRDLNAHGHKPGIYLWGGEPMLYRGSVEIIEEAARLEMPPSIATNGTGVAQHAERLVAAPMFAVQISVDGPDAQTHNACRPGLSAETDNFTVVKQAIDRLVEVRRAKRRRLPLIVTLTTINHLNYDRLMDIYEIFRDKVDVCVFYLSWWIDEVSAEKHARDFEERFGFAPQKHYGWIGGWRPPEVRELANQLSRLTKLANSFSGPTVAIIPPLVEADRLEAYYNDHDNHFGFDRCVSIYSAVEINSNGDMSPCRDYHDYVVGNVKEKTITALWNSEPYRRFRLSLASKGLMPVCTRCCGLMGY